MGDGNLDKRRPSNFERACATIESRLGITIEYSITFDRSYGVGSSGLLVIRYLGYIYLHAHIDLGLGL
jgi:hypothetical protein